MRGYAAANFISLPQAGKAGPMAAQLTTPFGAAPYFCKLVGAGFNPAPIATTALATRARVNYVLSRSASFLQSFFQGLSCMLDVLAE